MTGVSVLLLGCSASLPRGLLEFAPDGRHAALGSGGELGFYDLATQRPNWKTPSDQALVLSFSANGAFLVTNERAAAAEFNVLRVYRTENGKPVGRAIASPAGDTRPALLAVSDDGATVVNGLPWKRATIFDTYTGVTLWEGETWGPAVGFSRYSGQLAVARSNDILVLERRGNAMAEIAKVPSRGFFSWFPGGLAVLADGGVDLWDGHGVRRALEASIKYSSTTRDDSSFMAVSPDGRYFVNDAGAGLKVYDLGSGRELFARSDLKGVSGVAFRGQTLRVVWDDESSDDATFSFCSDLELPSGRTVKTRELGKRVTWVKKSLLNPHAGADGHFIPRLSPNGDFVDLLSVSLGDGHQIVAL